MALTHINPLMVWVPAGFLLIAALVNAYLFIALKIELRVVARRTVTRAELDTRFTELVTELETLRARLTAAESKPPQQPEWTPGDWTAPSLNLNRRGQILRLHGKGRTPMEIASDLQISQGEVELLLKVHDWSGATAL